MAPLAADLHSWATGGGPTLTVLALIFLFVIIVNLINLCTTCQKQSFELEHVGVERNSSTLVRVVKLEDALAAARENPDIDEIKKDEQELSSVPEEGVPPTQANGEAYTAWRNHSNAATQHSTLPEETQVGNGAPVGTSGANGGGGGGVGGSMDRTTTTQHKLHTIPMIALHNEEESGMRYAPPAVSVTAAPVHSKPAGSSQQHWARAQPEPTANHAGEVFQEPPDSLRVSEIRSQHTYETLSDMVKDPSPELSESPDEPLDVPSYQFVTQLEPYATSAPDLTEPRHTSAHSPAIEVEEIADLEDKHTKALYARVSRRIKCPTPPPVPPPEDDEEEEEVAEVVPPLPDRAPDTDNTLPQGL